MVFNLNKGFLNIKNVAAVVETIKLAHCLKTGLLVEILSYYNNSLQ